MFHTCSIVINIGKKDGNRKKSGNTKKRRTCRTVEGREGRSKAEYKRTSVKGKLVAVMIKSE